MLYTGANTEKISFPLGGIGTGSVGLGGNGKFIDWEIFNKPNKGSYLGHSHFAVRLTTKEKTYVKVLHGDNTDNLSGVYQGKTYNNHGGFGYGPVTNSLSGFPHFGKVEFNAEFPVATLDFTDEEFPGTVRLRAFNPMIPLDSFNSSLPAAFFEIEYENNTDEEVEFGSFLSLYNSYGKTKNQITEQDGYKGILMKNDCDEELQQYGDMFLMCENPTVLQEYWYRGEWMDAVVTYWNELTEGNFRERHYEESHINDTATVGRTEKIKKGGKTVFRFLFAWNNPWNNRYWEDRNPERSLKLWKNYYATQFKHSSDTAFYAMKKFEELKLKTVKFAESLENQTLDTYVKEAATDTISVLKTAIISRLENGEFYGFEGAQEHFGSCEGTCQHVYNYCYALCFLFPDLERSIRNLEYKHQLYKTGAMAFRLELPLEEPKEPWKACVDGQMGCVFKTYREWKISGDTEWLKSLWDKVKKTLDYSTSEENVDEWDRDGDGVLEGRQHHTLDVELFGPSSYLQGFYFLALKSAVEMAEALGDNEAAKKYGERLEKGRKWVDENLFNGEYYIQKVNLEDKGITEHFNCKDQYWNNETGEIKYQIGEGCEIDQVVGQWHSNILGLGEIFQREKTISALKAIYKYNYHSNMREFVNPWRLFALNDEGGTVMCSYPEGVRVPKIPLTYCQECMTGFEYAVGGLMISMGLEKEGLDIIRSVRLRYDGSNRNPWNDIECGSNYARSMSAFALISIYSGFIFDMPKGKIGFNPIHSDEKFSCFWSLGPGWGTFTSDPSECTAEILIEQGILPVNTISLPYAGKIQTLTIDGKNERFSVDNEGNICFNKKDISNSVKVKWIK